MFPERKKTKGNQIILSEWYSDNFKEKEEDYIISNVFKNGFKWFVQKEVNNDK